MATVLVGLPLVSVSCTNCPLVIVVEPLAPDSLAAQELTTVSAVKDPP